jgi:hypothetical protein
MRHRLCLTLLLVFSVAADVARAQDLPAYASGSFMTSWQGSKTGSLDPHLPSTGVGGTAIGVVGDVGRFLRPAMSISFELSLPATFESLQMINASLECVPARIDDAHRDTVYSGLFHFHVLRTGSVHLALIAGPDVVREHTTSREALGGSTCGFGGTPGVFGPYGAATEVARWTVGASGGVDLEIKLNRRVAIVPQVRIHVISREGPLSDTASGNLALSPLVIRTAIGVRTSF